MRQLRFILTLLLGSTIWGNVELSLINYSEAEGTAEVFYNSDVEIGGFQFDLEGAELTGASGGLAAENGFVQSSSPTTLLGFSFSGATIPADEGVLTVISFSDVDGEVCIINPVMSDGSGNSLDATLINNCVGGYEIFGCMDPEACDYNPEATIDGGCLYPYENHDCAGNCIVELDCNGECGGDAIEDNCGVCDSDSTNDCVQDCAGEWGGDSIADECGVCNGNGPGFLCENGDYVCNSSQCTGELDCEFGAGYRPGYGPGCQWNTFGSTVQSFISIGNITFNGESVSHGIEGGPTGDCPTNDCDILGVIYNGQSVGWSYLPVINNSVTVVVELKDANTEAVSGYPQVIPGIFEPVVTFNFYDASENKVYYNVGSAQPAVQSLVNLNELNITGDGEVCSTDGFEFGATEFCLEGNGCELTQYCNGESTTNFDAIGNNSESCELVSVCGHEEAVNLDSNIECEYFENDLSQCQFNGCEDETALNYSPDEIVGYEDFQAGCMYDPFQWIPSTQQSFYVINDLIMDGVSVTEENSNLVIGAFCNDVVVGSGEWNGTTTTIAVYGADGLTEGTENYCQSGIWVPTEIPGDIPTFKVYDPYTDLYYHTHFEICLDIEGNISNCEWFNFGYTNIPEITTTIPGCMDENACNYNEFATVDDGSCWSATSGCSCDFPQGSVVDCFGVCAGNAVEDDCGICNGFNADMDCAGDCFGSAVVDDCAVCSEGSTGLEFNSDMDCAGVCFGSAEFDICNECGGNGYDQCDYDENGISNLEQYGYGVYDIEVTDIPDDQGYQVYVSFTGSFLDGSQNISEQNSTNNREVEIYQVERLDDIGWVSVGQSVMYGQENYIVQIPTIINQTNESEGLSTFRVLSAFEDDVIVSFDNGVGASIDNIYPQIPNNLAGSYQNNVVQLNWENAVDDDFQYFKIYGNGEFLTYSAHSEFLDELPAVGINNYYQISAVDANGNESELSSQIFTLDICNNELSNCYGCTDEDAENFSMYAIMDDGNCEFSPVLVENEDLENYDEDTEITISDIELNDVEIDIEFPAGAFDLPEGSTINMAVSEASESEMENILYYSSSSESGIEIMQGISLIVTDENGNAIELSEGVTIDVAITFELNRNEYDLGFVQENGEIIGLNSDCNDNGDGTMTCAGEGENMGSYIVYSYSPDSMIMGCTLAEACNFSDSANMNDGSCFFYGIYDCAGNCVNDADADLVCDELEIPGCMDEEANNYDDQATDDNGTCNFGYSMIQNLSFGNNLLSLPGELENNSTIHQLDLIQSNGETIEFIIGQGVGLFNTTEGWTGNLNNLSPYSGYWINMSSADSYQWEIEFNSPIENCEVYPDINFGNNLVSFKWGEGSALTMDALGGEEFASENFNFIIGQGVGLFKTNEGWSGNLNALEEGKGYWVNVANEDISDFKWGFNNCAENSSIVNIENLESNRVNNFEMNVVQSTNQAFYLIDEILIDGKNPNVGDLVVAYNNDVIVGYTEYSEDLTILQVMGKDLSIQTESYLNNGESPNLKLHSHLTGEVTDLQFNLAGFDNLLVSQVNKIEVNSQEIPMDLVLYPAYPNPFNPTTTINFGIPEMVETQRVTTLQVFNINGHLIETLVNNELSPGNHSIEWDASQYPSGVYFVKLVSGDPSINSGQGFTQSQKLVLVK